MPDAYTDLLLRIFPYEASTECHPVEAELDDGSRFTGGKLRLDREALLAVELDPKAYGLLLFNALFAGDIRRAYDKATGIAEVQSGGRLRVRLWVDNEAVELHAIPWERLYHLYRGRAVPLTTSTLTPFSRYTSLEMRDPPPVSETPVRMLIAVSNPLDLPGGLLPANIEVEIDNLRGALGDLQREGKMQVTLLPGRTGLSTDLKKKVEAAGWQIADGITDLDNLVRLMTGAHIFHFIGHGHFRRKTEHGAGQAALFLEKEDGRWQAVTDDEIVSTLTSAGTLPHLIFLVACESATRDANAESPFVGLGPKLVQTGVPAVVAMQAQVPVELARQLSGEFYHRLMEHGEVDQALNQARLIVFDRDRTEWAIPVLFMRMKRGKLFGEPEGDEAAPAPGAPPYKGLEYFDEKDADKFFGREALVARLAGQLRDSRFLAVILGASGSGKSSVIRAGLIPALKRGQPLFDNTLPPEGSPRWPIHTFTPGARPLEALAATLTRAEDSVTATAILMEDLARDPRTLHLYVRKLVSRTDSKHLLLVVDQFEELFTLCKDDVQRKAFVDNLIYASAEAADGPTVVVIIFRADFYAHCAQFANLREAVSKRQEFIGPMSHDELRRAIEEPAKQGGWDLEPGLVDVLLQDVGDEPGALPLLQHALLETWKRRRARTMTLRGYTESGGIRGAIAKTAEAVYQQLPPEKQAVAKRIFLRLVELGEGTQDTRRRAELGELSPREEDRPAVEAVLKTLVDNRLITTTDKTAEVSHEALIREWPTLRAWLDQNRAGLRVHRDLYAAAREWESLMREPGGLYRGVRLVQAMEWAEENPSEMNTLESEFLAASKTEAEREANEKEEQQRRELEAARKLAEEQSRVAEAAQKLADAEKQRAAEQARAAARQRTLSRIMTGVGVVAFIAAVIAAQQWFAATQQKTVAQAASTQAVEQQLVAVTERANAETERGNAVAQQATAQAASTQAVQNAVLAEAQARLAFARGLASASISNLDADPERSVLLALRAVDVTYANDHTALPEAEEALHRALGVSRIMRVLNVEGVSRVAYSPDGTRLVIGGSHNTATVWDLATGEAQLTLTGHAGPITGVAYNPDGTRIATASEDRTAKIWDAATGRELLTLSDPNALIALVAFSLDGRRIATTAENIASAARATPEGDSTSGEEATPGGGAATGTAPGADFAVRIWDAATGEALLTLTGHTDLINAIAYSPDGRRIATASSDDTAKVWDAATGRLLLTLSGHTLDVNAVAFSPDGKEIATGSTDLTVIVWNAVTGKDRLHLSGHTDWIYVAAFSPDGAQVVSAGADGTVLAWDVRDGKELYTLSGHTNAITGLAFSPDGTRLATVSFDNTIRLWNAGPSQELLTLTSGASAVRRLAFSPDGTKLVTSGSDGTADTTAKVWDATTGRELLTLTGHAGAVLAVAFSSDGTRVATGSEDETAKIWDAATGRELLTLSGHTVGIRGVAFSPDGRKLATASRDGTLRVWDAQTGQALLVISNAAEAASDTPVYYALNGVAFSPDGAKLAATSDDYAVRVWEAETGRLLLTLVGHADWTVGVAFSPDGTKLITSSQDKTAKVWDASTGKELLTLSGHAASVAGVAISPDGKRIATASADRTVKMWDAATGRELFTLIGHTGRVGGVAFSPDGTRLASSGDDGTVRFYVLPVEELVALARSRVTRALTAEECDKYHIAPCPTEP